MPSWVQRLPLKAEKKPVVKRECQQNNQHSRHNKSNRRENHIKREKFLGTNPNLRGHAFKAKRNQLEQQKREGL